MRRLATKLCCLLLIASPALADDEGALELRAEATAGVRFYDLEDEFDDDDLSGFFDKYRNIDTKDDAVPWFADLFHLDVGLARDDDTYLVRLERWSPNWKNERDEIQIDWRGLDFDFDYRRFRTDELRVYPETTVGRLPTAVDQFAVNFNPDTAASNPLGRDDRLHIDRTGFVSSLALRPEDFGLPARGVDELQLFTRYEERDGRRQDRFLLDDPRELGTNGALQTSRFRAQRRKIDQEVHGVGGRLVLTPEKLFTSVLEFDFESFREEAGVRTLEDLASEDPAIGRGFSAAQLDRAFFFVPDTDRLSGSLRASRRFGNASIAAGGSISHLEQQGRSSPLQDRFGLEEAEVTTYTAHLAIDAPLTRSVGVNATGKYIFRNNGFDRDVMRVVAPPGGQVDPFLDSRQETTARVETTWRPRSGLLFAAGWRFRHVDRDLEFGDSPGVIVPQTSLQDTKSESHTGYARSTLRLGRGTQLSGETGYTWAPETGFVKELEKEFYFEGRTSTSLPRPFPITLSSFGRVRHGTNNDFELENRSKEKRYEVMRWSYGITLNAQPDPRVSVFASWVEQDDQQEFPHLRSNIPRYLGPAGLDFYRDSGTQYDSNVRNFVMGARFQATERIELSASGSLTYIDAGFDRGDRTGKLLDDVNQIDSRIASVETGVEFEVVPGSRLGLGYRYDDYEDDEDLDPLELDETVHTYTVTWTQEFNSLF